nr:partner of y14 and mago [Quercus suber]
MPPANASTTNSGIQKLDNGESIIPSSTRADGSIRKEIRVKAGYRPPEDVEVYKNRTAEAWKSRGKGGVPGAEAVGDDSLPPHKVAAAAAKNAKRREARRKAASDGKNGNDKQDDQTSTQQNVDTNETVDPQIEAAKEAKKLAKKLRQAKELKDKKENGDSLLPEQLAKVIKVQELIRQLDALGFDAAGEKRVEDKVESEV